MKYQDIERALQWLRRKKTTWAGLLTVLSIANPALFGFTIFVCKPALEVTELITNREHYMTFYGAVVACFVFLNGAVLATWICMRRLPSFQVARAGILFAPHSNPECNDLVEALYEGFCRELKGRYMSVPISHAFLPSHETVRCAEDAQELLRRSGAQVVIHGVVEKGQVAGQLQEGFTSISFTVRNIDLPAQEVEPFFRALAEMQFRFPLTNDLIGKAAVTESLADASCFFVAVGFTVQGRFLDARGIWEGLRRKLQMIPNTTRLQTLARLSQRWWEMNELLYCRQRLYREILPAITRPEGHAVAKECERIITVLRQANPKDPNFVLQHAILHFHFGDIQKARRDSEEAEELTNHEDPAPYFSLAFIALWQGKAKVALRHYRKVHRLGPPTAMVLGVLHFLEHVAAVHRDKSALRFALAIVNDLFFDQERAKKDYRDFLAMTKNDAESSDLIVHAQDRLAALSASEDSAVGIEATAPAI